jgi:hypothetical protein
LVGIAGISAHDVDLIFAVLEGDLPDGSGALLEMQQGIPSLIRMAIPLTAVGRNVPVPAIEPAVAAVAEHQPVIAEIPRRDRSPWV